MSKILAAASLAVLAASLTLSSARADGIGSVNCVGSPGLLSCVAAWRNWYPQEPQPPTEQELAEKRERIRRWEAHCRPVVKQDGFGVGRYFYAKPGCEYGKLD